MKEKLKSWLADDALYTALLVLGVGVLSFLLGRVSVAPVAPYTAPVVNPVTLCAPALCPSIVATQLPSLAAPGALLPTATAVVADATEKSFVVSKSGTKYHHVSCPGAKQIKEENKIYFASALEAEAAGYSKAANCHYE